MTSYALAKTIECRKIKKQMRKFRRLSGGRRAEIAGLKDGKRKAEIKISSLELSIHKEYFVRYLENNHLSLLVKLLMSRNKKVKSKYIGSGYSSMVTDNERVHLTTINDRDGQVLFFEFYLKGEL